MNNQSKKKLRKKKKLKLCQLTIGETIDIRFCKSLAIRFSASRVDVETIRLSLGVLDSPLPVVRLVCVVLSQAGSD